MKVILRQDHDKLGEAGKVIQVKPGYARNFLIPKGIVYPATADNIKRYDSEKEQLNMKKIQEQKKSICLHPESLDEVEKLLIELEPEGMLIFINTDSEEEADYLVKRVEDLTLEKLRKKRS